MADDVTPTAPVSDPSTLKPDLQKIHLRIMAFMVIMITFSFVGLLFIPIWFPIQDASKEIVNTMKDALINIMLIVVGYIFGSSVGSKLKSSTPAS